MKAIPKKDLINIIDALNVEEDNPVFSDTIENIFKRYGDEYYYDLGDSCGSPELCVNKSDVRRELLKSLKEDCK